MSTDYRDIIERYKQSDPETPYAAIINGMNPPQSQALRDAANQAVKTTPDAAAEVQSVAKTTALPIPVVTRNLDQTKAQAKADTVPYEAISRQSPRLAGWLTDPDKLAVTADDLPTMGYLDALLTKIGDFARAPISGLLLGSGSTIKGAATLANMIDRNLNVVAPNLAGARDAALQLPLPEALKAFISPPEPLRPAGQGKPWWSGPANALQAAGQVTEEAGKSLAVPREREGVVSEVLSGLGQFVPLIAASLMGQPELATAMFVGQGAGDMAASIDRDAAVPELPAPAGLVEPGNIKSLFDRPILHNADGSYSTTSSISFEQDGKEILVPTVIDGKRLSNDEAIAHYNATGENLGKFNSPESADAYAETLHNAQQSYIEQSYTSQGKKDLATLAGAGIAIGTGEFGLNMLLKRVPFPIKNAIVSKLADLAAAGGIQAVQMASQTLLNNVTKHILTNPGQSLTEGLSLSGSGTSALTGAAARAILTGLLGVPAESHFKDQQTALKETTQAVTSSKLFERDRETLRDFIATQAAGGAHENVHLPVEAFREYFQSRGVDPVQAAEEILPGGGDRYKQAAASGADMSVPFADYEARLAPEHGDFFDNELKFDPQDFSFNEAQEWMKKKSAEGAPDPKAAAAEDQMAESSDKIKQDIIGQISGHVEPVAADSNAASVAKVFTTLGQRMGVDPFELYSKYKLGIQFPLPEILKSKGAIDNMDTMLERIRSGDVPSKGDLFGKSLVEFLRENGGVRDFGGEVSKMEPDVPESRKGSRYLKKNPLVSDTGMELDHAVLRAQEEGYLPEGSDINSLLDSVDTELRGAPIYSIHALDTPKGQEGAVLFQLESLLKERGIDLKAMSNDEVKKLLEGIPDLSSQAGNVEFFQRDYEDMARDSVRAARKKNAEQFSDLGKKAATLSNILEDNESLGFQSTLEARSAIRKDPSIVDRFPDVEGLKAATDAYFAEVDRIKTLQSNGRPNPGLHYFKAHAEQELEATKRIETQRIMHGDLSLQQKQEIRRDVAFEQFMRENPGMGVKEFNQEQGNGKRGSLVFNKDGSFNLNLFAKRNLSTFLHETGHFYLEVFGDLVDELKSKAGVTGFTTAKGSTYDIADDGTTTRNKAARPEHPGEVGPQPRSERTFYVDAAAVQKLAEFQAEGGPTKRIAALPGDASKVGIQYVDGKDAGKFEARTMVSVSDSPTVGATPVELWKDGQRVHFGNEITELRGSALTDTQRTMLADYGKALKWLGVEDRSGIGEDQHEQFARGIEAYLREGKAPAIELRPLFARFRSWLMDLYSSVRRLNVEMNSEIKGVMDRLFATDAEIEAAEHEAEVKAVFMTQEESGLDEHGWRAYQDTLQKASDQARDTLQTKLMKEFAREHQQWWLAEEEKLRGEIASQVHKQPEYVALAALKRGENPDGSESAYKDKLDLNVIKEKFGRNTAATDRVRRLGIARLEGGVDPDVAAKAFGFSSGEALVEAIVNARPMDELIDADTHDEMIRRHGDMRLDGSIHDEAQRAVYGKYRDDVVRMEMRALKEKQRAGRPAAEAEASRQNAEREYERRWLEAEKKLAVAIAEGKKESVIESLRAESAKIREDQKAAAKDFAGSLKPGAGIPTAEQITRFASDLLADSAMKDVLPGKFWAAARKASREGSVASGKDSFDQALEAKRRELLNLELYRQANALKDAFEQTRTTWLKMFKPDAKVSEKRTMELVTAARAIAARYLFPDRQDRVDEALRTLKAYDPEMYESVLDELPAVMNDGRKLRDLKVIEFNGLRDIVAGLWEAAKTNKQILVEGKRVDAEGVRDELRAKMGGFKGGWNKYRAEYGDKTLSEKIVGKLAILRRMEAWVTAMDGGPDGPFRKYVWDVLNGSDATYRDAKLERLEQSDRLLDPIRESLTAAKIEAKEIGYTFKNKGELLGFLSHTGNKEGPSSNYWKLIRGGRGRESAWGGMREDGTLDDSKVRTMIARMQEDGTLTKADYDYVQGLWDLFEELKPGLQAAHKDINGYYFKEVPATPFETPWGTYRGGYVPAKADPILSDEAGIHELQNAIGESGNSFTLPSAGAGNTKSRTGVARPLELGLSYVPSHIDWALRYTHLEPRVREVYRLLNDGAFRREFNDIDPRFMKRAMIPWLRRVATQRISEVGLHGGEMDSTWSKLANGAAINTLTLSITNTLHQFVGLPIAKTHIPLGHLVTSAARMLISPKQMFEQATELSTYMRQSESQRARDLVQDYADSIRVTGKGQKAVTAVQRHGMILQRITGGFVNTVVWHAAFDHASAGGQSDVKAAAHADSVVRQTQHARRPMDVAAYESGTPFVRAMTMLSGWFNNVGNNAVTQVGNALRADKPLYDRVGRAVSVYAYGFAMPAIMAQSILNMVHGRWKEDDETDLHAALMLLFGSQVQMGTTMIPGFGQAGNIAFNKLFSQSTYGDEFRMSPPISITEEFLKSVGTAAKPDKYGSYAISGKEISDTLKFIGMLSGVPLGPAGNPLRFLRDVSQDKAQPKGPVSAARGLITGSIPKE